MNRSAWPLVLLLSCVSCFACGAGKAAPTRPEARSASPAASHAESKASPSNGDLTAQERDRFLGDLNDLCADTFCEGSFGFEFDGLECRFADGACAISFVMFTDDPTRDGLVPARLSSPPDAEEPFVAVIESVIPPSDCDPADVGMEAGGPPCTIVEAGCVLAPVRSLGEFESAHWDLLSHCVFALEDAILPETVGAAPLETNDADADGR